jgi:hypothetical protein
MVTNFTKKRGQKNAIKVVNFTSLKRAKKSSETPKTTVKPEPNEAIARYAGGGRFVILTSRHCSPLKQAKTMFSTSATQDARLSCFGFLNACILCFFGSGFRAFPAARILRRCSQGPCFIEFSGIYGPFGTPIFSRIFHHCSGRAHMWREVT